MSMFPMFSRWSMVPLILLMLVPLTSAQTLRTPGSPTRSWEPDRLKSYVDPQMGWMHGTQYWINPGSTPESIDEDFRNMAREDHINFVRLQFWAYPPGVAVEYPLHDACFDAGAKYGIKINPAFPQVPGWLVGKSDDPDVRAKYKEHIRGIIAHYKNHPALSFWTLDIEPTRSWKAEPTPVSLERFRQWLRRRHPDPTELTRLCPDYPNYDAAFPVNDRDKGNGWNNYQEYNNWLTFVCWSLAEQVLWQAEVVREADPDHAVSCTPPDVLHNQVIENGRNMWWLADAVDVPSHQMETMWHLETADMPEDVLAAQAATLRKVYCSSRKRGVSYCGEFLAGQELGEAPRLYSPTAEEIMGTSLVHLAEGSKGFLFWLWNPLLEGPNQGAWSLRRLDGAPTRRSRAAARFGKMIVDNNNLLYGMRPADTHVAIYDNFDAAIYLHKRSKYHPMFQWFAKNQYGFFKALRQAGVGCDFIDERGLTGEAINNYKVIYIPFSWAMTEEVAAVLKDFVARGGTIVGDCQTAWTRPNNRIDPIQPGLGLAEVFGVRSEAYEIVGKGYSEQHGYWETGPYFDRVQSEDPFGPFHTLYDASGKEAALVAVKLIQPVELADARALYFNDKQEPVVTVNDFGQGHALWTGTLLGMTCREAETPPARCWAVADLLRPYFPASSWKMEAPAGTIICRRLASDQGSVFVLFNENRAQAADFSLTFDAMSRPRELLDPQKPNWKQTAPNRVVGSLDKMSGCVIFCPATE